MSTATKKPSLVLKRLISAPRERVFKAWIDPQQFAKWWGPYEFTAPVVEFDARPGGKIVVHMQGPKGSPWEKPYPMGGEFREVSRYDRLVFTSTLPDGKGGLSIENLNELTFIDKGTMTELTLTVTVLQAKPEMKEALGGMKQGWGQSLEKLDDLVGAVGRISKLSTFKAPASRVWRALTDHEEFGKWFGVKLDEPFTVGRTSRGRITHPGYEHLEWTAEILTIEPETLLSFTWHPYAVDPKTDYSKEPPTTVEFRLEGSPSGSTLRITESGFDKIPAARRDEAFRMNEGGWTQQLKNIAAHLEG